MDAYFALAACAFFILMVCAIVLAVVKAEQVDHLEKVASRRADERLAMVDLIRRLTKENDKLREAIRPFDHDGDGMPGGNIDPYVKRALDRANAS